MSVPSIRRVVPWALLATTACAHMPQWLGGNDHDRQIEALYWGAVAQLERPATPVAVDSAVYLLDRYVVSAPRGAHRREATVLRRLAITTRQVAALEMSLQQTRAEAATRPRPDAEPRRADAEPRRDEESAKEIQRLKDELAKANAELERIRKRLANPREPPGG